MPRGSEAVGNYQGAEAGRTLPGSQAGLSAARKAPASANTHAAATRACLYRC